MMRFTVLLLLLSATAAQAQWSPECYRNPSVTGDETLVARTAGPVRSLVPETWLEPVADGCPVGVYESRDALTALDGSAPFDEWDRIYRSLLSQIFPNAAVYAHWGGEPFGPGAISYADLQVRVLTTGRPATDVADSVWTVARRVYQALQHARVSSVEIGEGTRGPWTRIIASAPLWVHDYGGTATFDVFVAECDGGRAVLAFMYQGGPEAQAVDLVHAIVDGSTCGGAV